MLNWHAFKTCTNALCSHSTNGSLYISFCLWGLLIARTRTLKSIMNECSLQSRYLGLIFQFTYHPCRWNGYTTAKNIDHSKLKHAYTCTILWFFKNFLQRQKTSTLLKHDTIFDSWYLENRCLVRSEKDSNASESRQRLLGTMLAASVQSAGGKCRASCVIETSAVNGNVHIYTRSWKAGPHASIAHSMGPATRETNIFKTVGRNNSWWGGGGGSGPDLYLSKLSTALKKRFNLENKYYLSNNFHLLNKLIYGVFLLNLSLFRSFP